MSVNQSGRINATTFSSKAEEVSYRGSIIPFQGEKGRKADIFPNGSTYQVRNIIISTALGAKNNLCYNL